MKKKQLIEKIRVFIKNEYPTGFSFGETPVEFYKGKKGKVLFKYLFIYSVVCDFPIDGINYENIYVPYEKLTYQQVTLIFSKLHRLIKQ